MVTLISYYSEIGDPNFKCALWTFKQDLALKIWARCGISIAIEKFEHVVEFLLLFFKRLCTVAFGIWDVKPVKQKESRG